MLCAACVWVVVGGGVASAAGQAVTGRLLEDGAPVAGVVISVTREGSGIASGRSDADGSFRVPVPDPGTYQVTLDTDSLPPGVALADPDRHTLPRVVVQAGADKTVVFTFVAEEELERPSSAERLAALALSGIRLGLVVAVAGVGLTLVYATTGIPNLAHGELVTFGALAAWYLNDAGIPLLVAGVLAVLLGGGFGTVLDAVLWRPLRRRGTDPVTVMVITIGLSLLLRNVYLLVFAGAQRPFADFAIQVPWRFGVVEVLPKSVVTMATAAALLVGTALFLSRTRPGTAMRAVGDVPDLARASGIDAGRTIRHVWVLATALAAAGGVLAALGDAVQWDLGLRLLLLMFAAVVLGGLGSVPGAMFGGLVIGVVSEVATYWIAPDHKTLIAMGALVLVLLVRPQGLWAGAAP